jgi:hypothetical protein
LRIIVSIIENNNLKAFNPVYINSLKLLLLGVHAKNPEKPNRLKWLGQIKEYLKTNKIILEKYENVIIAGDFNAGFKINDEEAYSELIKLFRNEYYLKNCVQNYSKKYIPTYYKPDALGYVDDFIFLSDLFSVKIIEPTDKTEWEIDEKGNKRWGYIDKCSKGSDHCPLVIEIVI